MATTRRTTPAESLSAWTSEYADTYGTPASRTVTLATASPQHQEFAAERVRFMGQHLPELVSHWLAGYDRTASSPNANETNRILAARAAERLRSPEFQEEIKSRPDTSMEAGAKQFSSLIHGTSRVARSRTNFEEQQNPGHGVLYLPAGPDFYPVHHANYEHVGKASYGSEYSPEIHRNLILAGTRFSAGASPQVEIQGASGLAAIHAHRNDIGFRVSHSGAQIVNQMIHAQLHGADTDGAGLLSSTGEPISAGKRGKRIIDPELAPSRPLEAGTHRFGDLDPAHQAIFIAHRAGAGGAFEGLTPHVDYGTTDWSEPAQAIRGAAGTSGVPSIHKSLAIMKDPSVIKPSDEGEQKLFTYGMTTLTSIPEHAEVIRHLVGAKVHGDRYWERNPEAAAVVRRHINDLGMRNPFVTSDIHHARAVSGFSPAFAKNLDDPIRPDARFVVPAHLRSHLGESRVNAPAGLKGAHLAYLTQEHQAMHGDTSVNVPGYGKFQMTPHIRQAWGWGAVQGAYPQGRAAIAAGTKSLIHQDVQSDMSLALNPQRIPRIFRL